LGEVLHEQWKWNGEYYQLTTLSSLEVVDSFLGNTHEAPVILFPKMENRNVLAAESNYEVGTTVEEQQE